jgi:hypothetical protein
MTVFSEMEQVNAFNNFQKKSSGPYSETYNPWWRNHPNFSWKQNQPPQIKEELHMRHHLIKPHSSHNIIDIVIGRDHEGLYEND